MSGHELTVRAAEDHYPGVGRRGTVLMLPGRAYSCDMSLLAWTTRALQATGWAVVQAGWNLSAIPADPRAFIQDAARRLDEMKRPGEPVLVVAKSLGTLAAHWGAEKGYPAVWLTPVLKAAGRHPLPSHSEELASRLRDYPAPNLVVGGTADIFWQRGFTGTGEVLEIAGADHSLEVADWRASVHQHEAVASAVVRFASGAAG
ncbi:hypothetical protein [Nocardioides sp.]|uniref:hypothetical protein n=1 Tax=Nocardioides sp. TaxID=35761 RepID=UPI003D14F290